MAWRHLQSFGTTRFGTIEPHKNDVSIIDVIALKFNFEIIPVLTKNMSFDNLKKFKELQGKRSDYLRLASDGVG